MEQAVVAGYLGIDLSDKTAMISYYQLNMSEPETVSTIAGGDAHHIPAVLAKRREIGQWYYGDEAKKKAMNGDMIIVDSLLNRAINKEQIIIEDESYQAEELLALFLQKIIMLPRKTGMTAPYTKLVICLERLTRENMELFWRILPKLGFTSEQFMIIDHKASFYYFALSQEESLWAHDVFLFEYEKDVLKYYGLKRDIRTKPQVISIYESSRLAFNVNKDQDFYLLLKRTFENQIVSTVYLVGDGFEGNWMNQSIKFLCKGRRAFMGRNLFSKGACYAAKASDLGDKWKFIYMGENEMKFNLSLKVKNNGMISFFNMISAGKNWFEEKSSCEVILSDTHEIDFWKQLPNSREAKIETLELTDFPVRPDRTTRVRITAQPISDDKVEIEIKDLGFGELFRSTDKVWHYTMVM